MSQRKPPFVWARVVKACRSFSPTEKLIWLEHLAMANGKGGAAWISATGLGRRLALCRVTVERARQKMLRDGLMTKRDRGQGRTADWFPCLPSCCRPIGQRLTDDEVEKHAEQLDRYIAKGAGTSLTDEGGQGADCPETGDLTHPMSEL